MYFNYILKIFNCTFLVELCSLWNGSFFGVQEVILHKLESSWPYNVLCV